MPGDDISKLEDALNRAAASSSALWTTFITFQLYIAIAFGSVTHSDLFLESPIKLPLLNVELPLVSFFAIVPVLLVIFHFYIFLQLLALSERTAFYDTRLSAAPDAPERHRLDSFFILQFLVGPTSQRQGFNGLSLRLIAWITLVGTPILILVQGQLVFLPYHHEGVTWIQRLSILADLSIIWFFWDRLRRNDSPMFFDIGARDWKRIGILASVLIGIFSVILATFSGELVDELPSFRIIPEFSFDQKPHEGIRWKFDFKGWFSPHEVLFGNKRLTVTQPSRALFQNRIILTDHTFVDAKSRDTVEASRSLRGRDLVQAILKRSDLRNVDFTNSTLRWADLEGANLQNARFSCTDAANSIGCADLEEAILSRSDLRGAILDRANASGAKFLYAQLHGATLDGIKLQGSHLNSAQLQGASIDSANLERAWITGANVDGAAFDGSQVAKAEFKGVDLEFASLNDVNLKETSPPSTAPKTPSIKLLERLTKVGCEADSPYIIQGLVRSLRGDKFKDPRVPYSLRGDQFSVLLSVGERGELASAFLDEDRCVGARHLQDFYKDHLRALRGH
jgi:uncharacterized protein YjbI with pentapeptide repeats